MGRVFFSSLSGCIVSLLLISAAHAYTPTVSSGGRGVRWSGAPKLYLAGNPTNRVGMDEGSFFRAVVRSLQRWQAGSTGVVGFDYWQGTNPGVYEPNSTYNGLSSVYFASAGGGAVDPNVLGLTQVWYNTDTGQILETDVVLNDVNFRFTMNPKDTSGFGGVSSGAGRPVYIENVLTHEFGHALGLSHSGGLQSTMLFMESPEQAHLGCDEQVAIHAIYGGAGARGSISGQVVQESGTPIFGTQVVAVSRQRGTVLATAITDPSGHYSIDSLEPGTYYLMVEPFYAGNAALPAFYANANPLVCSGRVFGRSFLTESDGFSLKPVEVAPGGRAVAPHLVALCRGGGGAAVVSNASSASVSTAPTIYTGGAGFGASDRFNYSGTLYYKLSNLSGQLDLTVMSYSLYSPIRPTVTLLDSGGGTVSAQIAPQVYQGDSGYVNYDTRLLAQGLAPGEYTLRISGSPMNASQYPAGPVSLDSVSFMVVTGSVNGGTPALADQMPLNARCRMDESFAAYVSPPGNPPRFSTQSDGDDSGFCGTVQTPSKGGNGPGAGTIVSWFLPWLFMGFASRWTRLLSRA